MGTLPDREAEAGCSRLREQHRIDRTEYLMKGIHRKCGSGMRPTSLRDEIHDEALPIPPANMTQLHLPMGFVASVDVRQVRLHFLYSPSHPHPHLHDPLVRPEIVPPLEQVRVAGPVTTDHDHPLGPGLGGQSDQLGQDRRDKDHL